MEKFSLLMLEMSLVGRTVKGAIIVQDPNRKEIVKIDGVVLGESVKFSYKTALSTDIGRLLDNQLIDPQVVVIVYENSTGKAYIKSGLDLSDPNDSKINSAYTSFIVDSRGAAMNPPTQTPTVPTPTNPPSNSSGFLKTNGREFTLDGKKYIACGFNAYWLALHEDGSYPSKTQVEEMFIAAKRMGCNTIRSHTLGHSSGSKNSLRPWDNSLNENAWDSIDYAFSMANTTSELFLC
jgi:hypothetical protein